MIHDFSIRLGECVFRVFPGARYCETVFLDGTKVPAVPHDTEEYRARARELGYGGNTWAMCLEHELFHTVLALGKGFMFSPTLWDVAHGQVNQAHWIEEREVLDFQRALRACVDA